ncbi:MAG: VOC family protein [Pseudomonadota bacterium]|nr:VOC family protein [Pseudomonadota bacterium]MEE3100313.1 VOC family protein [Pseudomonadota bacterium]
MLRRVNFVSIPVTDQDRALAFYRDLMGMEVQTDAPYGDDWRWIFLRIPGAETLIQFARAGEVSVSGVPALVLVSDDVDAETARLSAAGATVEDGPADAPWHAGVRYALIRDSERNLILLQSSPMET